MVVCLALYWHVLIYFYTRCHPDALQYVNNFKKKKEELAKRLYHLYNKQIFDGILPADMEITWNVRWVIS